MRCKAPSGIRQTYITDIVLMDDIRLCLYGWTGSRKEGDLVHGAYGTSVEEVVAAIKLNRINV
ncbi:hypothetical protein [Paenibacillus sp. sgz500958]|uniref:hypothetical protein n=1 Tax=Paenibacillus sp. sgz500958 TaxID=3242475 RepID=UPI0036D3D6F3